MEGSNTNKDRVGARYLRLGTIRHLFHSGELSREEALSLLNAPLTPGKPETMSDDRKLLDMSSDELIALFQQEYNALDNV